MSRPTPSPLRVGEGRGVRGDPNIDWLRDVLDPTLRGE
jgi:hypothetical protein